MPTQRGCGKRAEAGQRQDNKRESEMKKERVLILVSPNGTLTATYAGSLKRLPDHKHKWQQLLSYKAVNAIQYRDAAYTWLIHAYGL